MASYNYILLRTALILYLLLHTSRYLDHPCDCESFRAGHSRGHLVQGLCEEVEWIGTKQGEGCIKGEGGGGVVGEGGYGGEGREEGGHNSIPTSFGMAPEKLKEYCGQQRRRTRANSIRLGSPNIFDVHAQIVFVSAHPTSSS